MAPASVPTDEQLGFDSWQYAFFSRLNARFENSSASEIITWSVENFGGGLSISSALGASGMVLIDLALQVQPDVDIFYIDTGYFFSETQALIERVQEHYQRPFRRVTPAQSVDAQRQRYGGDLHASQPDLCCSLRKVEPMRRALVGSTAWMTALRRDQASTRAQTPVLQWSRKHNVVKVAPLVHWTEADIWDYVQSQGLPYNELHDRGYPSVGCWPCTRAVQPGEELRAGRWSGMAKTECGLHWPVDVKA